MPGYLTHAMVLIRTVQWLQAMRLHIEARTTRRRAGGSGPIALDERLHALAGRALTFLLETPVADARPALPVARISNGVGDGMSKWALVGSLGPDLPAAGNILAINRDWSFRQLHNGGTRRAFVDARSTSLVLKLLELAEQDEKARPLTSPPRTNTVSYALGHLSHVAADVLLHPAVHQLADAGGLDPLKHRLFEVAVDARVAHGFFQRKDLNDDIQSWEEYYLDKGDFKDALTLFMGQLSHAFKDTYGDVTPNQPVCGLADPARCLAPKFESDFLMDSYRNTVNWALDEGYDHGPETFDFFWTAAAFIAAAGSAWFLSSATNSESTITNTVFGANQADITQLSADALEDWRTDGAKSFAVWRDVIDESMSWPDYVSLPFELLMSGGLAMKFLTFWQAPDGIFGQGTADFGEKPVLRRITDIALPIKTVGLRIVKEAVPKFANEDAWEWAWFVVDTAQYFLEHGFLTNESRKDNVEADLLAHTLWLPKFIFSGFLFIGNGAAVLWKSARTTDGQREAGVAGLDFFLPLVSALAASAIFVWPGTFRNYLLRSVAGAHWPSADTKSVDSYLPVEVAEAKRRFTATGASRFKVRLFADDPAVIKEEGGRKYFPEGSAAASDVEAQPKSDADARRAVLNEWPDEEYTLPDLFDHAARFAGLLSLSAVAYNDAAPPVRQHLTSVFKDWNLDYASVTQWTELMKPGAGADMGLLTAVQTYTAELESRTDTPSDVAIQRLQSALGLTEIAGAVDADFARTGQFMILLNTVDARTARLTRPGAVLLPNLDVDTPAPSPLPSPLPLRTGDLDALRDDAINAVGNDLDELTEMRVTKPAVTGSPHTLVLRLHADDASRVRVFEKGGGPRETWPVVLGFTAGGVKIEHELPPGPPDVLDYVIELKSFAGDPGFPAPSGPGPLAPAPHTVGGVAPGSPVVTERRPGEIWIEVIHKDAGTVVPGIRDVALFSAAPFMHVGNERPTERLYAMYVRDVFTGAGTLASIGNHPFVADIVRALRSDALLGPRVDAPVTPAPFGVLDEFVPHKPVRAGDPGEAKLLYVVDGDLYAGDVWLQDEFEVGYAHTPRTVMSVVLHNPRKRELAPFVESELPSVDFALFNGVSESASSINYGGNLEVSPPVDTDTPAQSLGSAGREVPAQVPAPLGKILLGEGTPFLFDIAVSFAAELQARTVSAALVSAMDAHDVIVDTTDAVEVLAADREWQLTTAASGTLVVRRGAGVLKVHAARLATPAFKKFLAAQRAQPVVTFDTSWLSVGHVDEVMVFVPAFTGGKSFRLLMASSALGIRLLDEAKTVRDSAPGHPLTSLFRGQQWRTPRPGRATTSAVQTVDAALTEQRSFNNELQTRRLTPIETRLRDTLALDAADVIRVPVIYDAIEAGLIPMMGATVFHSVTGAMRRVVTAAYTPNGVNLQIVDKVALVPRPHGPRMKADDAATVLRNIGVAGVAGGDLSTLVGNEQWVRRGTSAASLAATFSSAAAAIRGHARNAGKFTGAGTVLRNWDQIFIPEDNVDLFEAFMHVQLTRLGLSVHFIEDWDYYHSGDGEVHCGTNARRTPAEAAVGYAGKKWWEARTVTE